MINFEEFSLETQEAIDSFRTEFWPITLKWYEHNGLSKSPLNADICAQRNMISIGGWLMARGALVEELCSACYFIQNNNLWVGDFIK